MIEKAVYKILPPKMDVVFKLLFGDNRNINILRSFLKAVLDMPIDEYDIIKIVDPILKQEDPEDKLGILDVRIETKTGKQINIEIQVAYMSEMPERIIYYNSKMLTTQIKSGQKYKAIQKTISIVIVNFNMIKDSKKYHNVFKLYEKDTHVQFSDIVEINTLELTKIPKESDNSEAYDWMSFLKAEKEEEFKMIADRNKEINIAYAELKKLSQDENNQMIYELRQKAIMDEDARIRWAEYVGVAKGKAEGEISGKIKSCVNMVERLKSSITDAMNVVELDDRYKDEIVRQLTDKGIEYTL